MMHEVFPGLFVGDADAAASVLVADGGDASRLFAPRDGWTVISAAKDPWHRAALGYAGRAAPADHPEYLFARRGNHLICNLVDAPDPKYIRKEIIGEALAYIVMGFVDEGDKVLVHCNQGQSRAPGIALMYLRFSRHQTRPWLARLSFDEAIAAFREIYPPLELGAGMDGFLRSVWDMESWSDRD